SPRTPPLFPYTTLFRSGAADELSELAGGAERLPLSRVHDTSGDAAREALLTEVEEDVGQFAFRALVHEIGRRHGLRRIHAHVERSEEHTSELQSPDHLV